MAFSPMIRSFPHWTAASRAHKEREAAIRHASNLVHSRGCHKCSQVIFDAVFGSLIRHGTMAIFACENERHHTSAHQFSKYIHGVAMSNPPVILRFNLRQP